jgi:hypothetical protein
MSQQMRPDDRPGVTPIQQDAGLTPAQQEYWDPQGRDGRTEAQILQKIADAINLSKNATQPAVSATGSRPQ